MKHWCFALLLICLVSPLVAQETPTPQIVHPVIEEAVNAITPDNVASLVPLKTWGDGRLREVSWTDDDKLRVITTLEDRIYDPDALDVPLSAQKSWPEGTKSPDGRLLLIDHDWEKILRDFETGEDIAHFKQHGSAFFDATGRSLVLSRYEDKISIIDLYNVSSPKPRQIHTFQGMGSAIFFKNNWLITQEPSALHAINLETEEVVNHSWGTPGLEVGGFAGYALSPDGNFLAIGYHTLISEVYNEYEETLLIYDISDLAAHSFKLIYRETLTEHETQEEPTIMAWAGDNERLLVGQSWKQIMYQHTDDHIERLWVLDELGLAEWTQLVFSPDGEYFATSSTYYGSSLYKGRTRVGEIFDGLFAFSPDSGTLAVGQAGTVILIDTQTGEMTDSLDLDTFGEALDDLYLNRGFSPDRTIYAVYDRTTEFQGSIFIKDTASGELILRIADTDAHSESPRISPDNRLLAVFKFGHRDRPEDRMVLYDTGTGAVLDIVDMEVATGQYLIADATFSGNSQIVAWSGWDDRAGIYNVQTGKKIVIQTADNRIAYQSIALNFDGSLLFQASARDGLIAWTTTGERLDVPAFANAKDIIRVTMLADGSRLSTLDRAGRFTEWGLPE